MKPMLYAFPGCATLADALCAALGAERGALGWRRFPDGESLVTLGGDCRGRDVAVVCTLRDPDPLALPLLFAAQAARDLGARSVGLVAPYLAYMRQDARFRTGECVSSVPFARFVSSAFDWLATVDPHLHRYRELGALYAIASRAVHAAPLIAECIRTRVDAPVLIGPDAESAQWLEPIASAIGASTVVLDKVRRGDRDVAVSAPDAARLAGRTPVLVDDIASSGRTLVETALRLRALGTRAPVAFVVHALFGAAVEQALRESGITRLVSTNTVEHASNGIDVTPVLAPAVADLIAARAETPTR